MNQDTNASAPAVFRNSVDSHKYNIILHRNPVVLMDPLRSNFLEQVLRGGKKLAAGGVGKQAGAGQNLPCLGGSSGT